MKKKLKSVLLFLAVATAGASSAVASYTKLSVSYVYNIANYGIKQMGFYLGLEASGVASLKGYISFPDRVNIKYNGFASENGMRVLDWNDGLAVFQESLPLGEKGANTKILTFPNGYRVLADYIVKGGFFFSEEYYFSNFRFIEKATPKIKKLPKLMSFPEPDYIKMAQSQLRFSKSTRFYLSQFTEDREASVQIANFVFDRQARVVEKLFEGLLLGKDLELSDLVYANSLLGEHTYSWLPEHSDSEVSSSVYLFNESDHSQLAGVIRGSEKDFVRGRSFLSPVKGGGLSAALLEFPESDENIKIQLEEIVSAVNAIDKEHTDLIVIARLYKDFMSLHPFYDGNGRLARVLLDYMMTKAGYAPINHNAHTAKIHWMSVEEVAAEISKSGFNI